MDRIAIVPEFFLLLTDFLTDGFNGHTKIIIVGNEVLLHIEPHNAFCVDERPDECKFVSGVLGFEFRAPFVEFFFETPGDNDAVSQDKGNIELLQIAMVLMFQYHIIHLCKMY